MGHEKYQGQVDYYGDIAPRVTHWYDTYAEAHARAEKIAGNDGRVRAINVEVHIDVKGGKNV